MAYKSDLKTYRELSKPFDSQAEAQTAINAFWEDLSKIRKQHGIADIVCTVAGAYMDGDEEAAYGTFCEFGDVNLHEGLAAHTLGMIQAERQARIGKFLKAGGAVQQVKER